MSQIPFPAPENNFLVEHTELLRHSFQMLTGNALIDNALPAVEAAKLLFQAPFVLLSHNTDTDPILTYGNLQALKLFELTWEQLTAMPSRLTAELPNRAERARLLHQVSEHGYIDDYSGIRVSKTGKRFLIERATVWNLIAPDGNVHGQAATFGSNCQFQNATDRA